MQSAKVALLGLLAALSAAAHADDTQPDSVAALKALSRFGFVVEEEVSANSCVIKMDIDQHTLLDHFSELQTLGILNGDLRSSAPNIIPFTLSAAFIMSVAPITVKAIYEGYINADRCLFSQTISAADDYGNDQKIKAIGFKFSRQLYKKINWDNFDASRAIKVFPSFKIEPALAAKMAEER